LTSENRVYGHCRTCSGLGVYMDQDRKACFFLNGNPHIAHPVDFFPDGSLAPEKSKLEADSAPNPGTVKIRVTDAGSYYSNQSMHDEIFVSVQDENEDPQSDLTIVKKLGVDVKDILTAQNGGSS